MAGKYDRQAATAFRIIKDKGEAVVWAGERFAVTADAATPWLETSGVAFQEEANIAFFPLDRQWSELIRYLKGTEVVTGSVYGIMPPHAFIDTLTDVEKLRCVVTRQDGAKFMPLTIEPLKINEQTILYTIEFRK